MFGEKRYPESLSPEELDIYLANGWYRMGQSIFTTHFLCFHDQFFSALWVRLSLKNYEFSKSLRKIIRRNYSAFDIRFQPVQITPEKEALYQKYKQSFPGQLAPTLEDSLHEGFDGNIYNTFETLVYDGDKLIAVTGTAEVVEWTGSDWINIRVLPQVEPVVLFRGAPISLSDVEATWLAPEGPRWRLIDLAVVENRLFAISTRTMSYPGGSPIDGALQELVGDAWHTVAVIGGDFQGRWDGMIGFVQGCGESVYFSGGTPNEQDDTWDLIRTSGQQMACLDGSPYVIFEYYGGLYQLVDGVHVPLGSVAHPSQILAVATYEGNVFIGGEFSEVDGIPSQNLASYSP